MNKQTEKLKKQVLKQLEKLKMKQNQVDNLIEDIEDKIEAMNGEKPVKTGYGTSCLRLTTKDEANLLTEY